MTPGNMDVLCLIFNNGRSIALERDTQIAFGSTPASGFGGLEEPLWLAIRANSATSYDWLVSTDGRIWKSLLLARNPAITVASVGVAVNPDSASVGSWGAFDFLRIWNSAKAFPGV